MVLATVRCAALGIVAVVFHLPAGAQALGPIPFLDDRGVVDVAWTDGGFIEVAPSPSSPAIPT